MFPCYCVHFFNNWSAEASFPTSVGHLDFLCCEFPLHIPHPLTLPIALEIRVCLPFQCLALSPLLLSWPDPSSSCHLIHFSSILVHIFLPNTNEIWISHCMNPCKLTSAPSLYERRAVTAHSSSVGCFNIENETSIKCFRIVCGVVCQPAFILFVSSDFSVFDQHQFLL